MVPRKILELATKYEFIIPKSTFLQPEKQQNVRALLKEYYNSLSKHLVRDHKEMREYEKQNRRILHSKGELSQERKEKLESLQISFEKLLTATQSFADILDEDLPVLPTETFPKEEETMIVTGTGMDAEEGATNATNMENLWGDIETQRFYCELPELQVFLPTSFLQKDKDKSETVIPADAVTEETLDSELPAEELEDDGEKEI